MSKQKDVRLKEAEAALYLRRIFEAFCLSKCPKKPVFPFPKSRNNDLTKAHSAGMSDLEPEKKTPLNAGNCPKAGKHRAIRLFYARRESHVRC